MCVGCINGDELAKKHSKDSIDYKKNEDNSSNSEYLI